ncbi:MAG TPA: DNA methyltransferase, partial [Kiritimatiellia bacterium]|nr:DNA methyltransferase [Kiritimatiellia bacterium]
MLNGICPYFTMFPLEFPYRVLRQHAGSGGKVLDPFCGRGTSLYAARMLGMPAYGIDSNPVAVAISRAKLANATPTAIVAAAQRILNEPSSVTCPDGEFWRLAYAPKVLESLCRLRSALLDDASSAARQSLVG